MTEPTHLLLIPMDPSTAQAADSLIEQMRRKLPDWVRPVVLFGARGGPYLLPVEPPA